MISKVFFAAILGIVMISNLMPQLMPAKLAALLIMVLSAIGLLGIFDRVFV